jgi:hypothetical protein
VEGQKHQHAKLSFVGLEVFFHTCSHFLTCLLVLLKALERAFCANRAEQCGVEGICWPNRKHGIHYFHRHNIDDNSSDPFEGQGARRQGHGVPTRHAYQSLCK